MKANELMIGDHVDLGHRDLTLKVLGLDSRNGVVFVETQNYLKLKISYDEEEIKPIPLTKEILKANGFEYIEAFGQWWQMHNDRTSSLQLITDDIDDVDTLGVTVCDCGSMKLKYVHELQHALRLCGLNDLADNFKTE